MCLRAILGTLCVFFALYVRKLKYIFFQLMKYAHETFLFLSKILVIFLHELTSYSTWQCHVKLVLIIRYFFDDLICIYDVIVCFYSCIVIIISP